MKSCYPSLVFILLVLAVAPEMQAQNGTPHPDDGYWDNRFGHPYIVGGGIGSPTAVAKNGKLYLSSGVSLTFRNGYRYYGISIWDGNAWTYHAPSSTATVFEVLLPVGDTTFYGAGNFQNLDGQGINYITYWDGTQWNALTPQLNDRVRVMYAGVEGLYVGGDFNRFGDSTANRIVVWDGSKWNKMIDAFTAEGVNGTVWGITATQSHLYLAGSFTNAGGLTAVNRVAQWNWTTKQWAKVTPDGLNSDVFAITNNLGALWVGGWFDHSGVRPVEYVAELTDTGWVGRKANLPSYPTWGCLYSPPSGGVYAVGNYYDLSGDGRYHGIVYHNGSEWAGLGAEPMGSFFITGEGSNIYASVGITHDTTKYLRGTGMWNGVQWQGLGGPIGGNADDLVHALGYSNGALYAAGTFQIAGDRYRPQGLNLAMFKDGRWQDMGGRIMTNASAGYVYAFATIGTDLYAGGSFSKIGSTALRNIGKWNGSAWAPLGSGVNKTVRAMATNGTDLFVVGIFDSAGGQWVNGIAKWNGSTWARLGGGLGLGIGFGENPKTIAVNGNEVYVAGRFNSVDSGRVAAEDFARWNGSEWSAIPPPPNPITGSRQPVEALAMIGNDLYAAVNYFSLSGNFGFVFKWNGTEWSQIGGMFDRYVYGLYANGTDLYVAGDFEVVGTDTIWGIAKWNGSSWSGLGTGITGGLYGSYAKCVLGTPDGLLVGGSFRQAGKYISGCIALWKNYTHQGQLLGLNTPILSSPPDGAIDQPLTLSLSWDAVLNATGYGVQLSTDSLFATTLVNVSGVAGTTHEVSGLSENTKYFWRIQATNDTQTSNWSEVWDFRTGSFTSVDGEGASPTEYSLGQNYPNPFNPATVIEYALPEQSAVELSVYDLLGRRIAVLVQTEQAAGYHRISWEARALPSGMYFYRLHAHATAGAQRREFVQIKKLILLR